MAKPRDIVYWDSDAFLGLINKKTEPEKCELCERVWTVAEDGKIFIVTSTLTIAEVIHMKGSPKLDPDKRPIVNKLFQYPFIIQKPLTRIIAQLARDVVWDSKITPKDSVHVATAAYYKINVLHTFDRGLLDKKTIDVNGFLINAQKPYAQPQVNMNFSGKPNEKKD